MTRLAYRELNLTRVQVTLQCKVSAETYTVQEYRYLYVSRLGIDDKDSIFWVRGDKMCMFFERGPMCCIRNGISAFNVRIFLIIGPKCGFITY